MNSSSASCFWTGVGLFTSVWDVFALPQLMLYSVYLNPTSFAGGSSALLWFDNDSKQAGRTVGPRLSAHSHGIVLNLLRLSHEHLVRVSVAATKRWQGGEEGQVHTCHVAKGSRNTNSEQAGIWNQEIIRRLWRGAAHRGVLSLPSSRTQEHLPREDPTLRAGSSRINHSLRQCPTAGSSGGIFPVEVP